MNPIYYDKTQVFIHETRAESGVAAAQCGATLIRNAIAQRGRARIIIGTGNSQLAMIDSLMSQSGIDWTCVTVFHMDEYVGLTAYHSASFRRWLRIHVAEKKTLAATHYIDGDAADIASEIKRYSQLLAAAPIDLSFIGFGENGHIAFNDPANAIFDDPEQLKIVTLDDACRRQQVGEGHFRDVDSMPREAVTITCAQLFRAEAWVCCVPERRKAEAVRDALEGPIATSCPASLVRTHPDAVVFLDADSASLLENRLAQTPGG